MYILKVIVFHKPPIKAGEADEVHPERNYVALTTDESA
jgi:hypothetical protein